MRRSVWIVVGLGLAAAIGQAFVVVGAEFQEQLEPRDGVAAGEEAAVVDHPARRIGPRRHTPQRDPHRLMSQESLLGFLDDLTSIQPFSGWRYATTRGEAQAFDDVEQTLSRYSYLRSIGLEIDLHPFRTYKGLEFWETRVELTIEGQRYEVPADGSPGHRDRFELAMRFDSDGALNDSNRDPVVVEGNPLVVRSSVEINTLTPAQVAGRVVLLDFAVIDRTVIGFDEAVARGSTLLQKRPAGVVLVTSFSNRNGDSHGGSAGDLNAYTWVDVEPQTPILNVRIEDLAPLGIDTWTDLDDIQSVRLTWDVDLYSPGQSAYLVARIPGADSSRAVILGAHIDSPNTPGALDNGSGSVALLEVARVLNRAWTTPPTDLYLVWFGGHEVGVYGSQNFANDHSELLDRTIAMLQMDCLGHPLDGLNNRIFIQSWAYSAFGDDRATLPDYLDAEAGQRGVSTFPWANRGLSSDNNSLSGYDVPNANMMYMDPYDDTEIHYANHWHDPYDTVELAEAVSDAFEDMTRVMLIAALELGADDPDLRVTPYPDRRALFVASHTEGAHMSPASLTEFGMALAWEGFDVDTIPYGQLVTADDLADADLVVALPVHDYPSPDGDVSLYDEAWTAAEIDALDDYVRDGGLLVLTNTSRRLKYYNYAYDDNEDWSDQNDLGERFDVSYDESGGFGTAEAFAIASHPLMLGVDTLEMADDNAVRFSAPFGEELARAEASSVVAVVDAGSGEVVVLADVGLLGTVGDEADNIAFWRNLARYAR
jgi:hypothetical protein